MVYFWVLFMSWKKTDETYFSKAVFFLISVSGNSYGMIFIISCDSNQVTFIGQNSHSSTVDITVTSDDLSVDSIDDCEYGDEGELIVLTSNGNFTIEDHFTNHAGIEVSLFNSSHDCLNSWGNGQESFGYQPVITSVSNIGQCHELAMIIGSNSEKIERLFNSFEKKNKDLNKRRKAASCQKLSSVLFRTEKTSYPISTLTISAQQQLEWLFNYLPDINHVISFLSDLYNKSLSVSGLIIIRRWYEKWQEKRGE